jgi:hypothetical protein
MVVKKGPFHFFTDKHEDVVATENKMLISDYANKTKLDIRSTSEDVVEKNFEIFTMLVRGIEMVYSTPQSKSVSNRADFFIFFYTKKNVFFCLQITGIDLERAKNMMRDSGYASDAEYDRRQNKTQTTTQSQDTRNSNLAVQSFRQNVQRQQQQAVEMREASVEVDRNDMDERDLDDFLLRAREDDNLDIRTQV